MKFYLNKLKKIILMIIILKVYLVMIEIKKINQEVLVIQMKVINHIKFFYLFSLIIVIIIIFSLILL